MGQWRLDDVCFGYGGTLAKARQGLPSHTFDPSEWFLVPTPGRNTRSTRFHWREDQ